MIVIEGDDIVDEGVVAEGRRFSSLGPLPEDEEDESEATSAMGAAGVAFWAAPTHSPVKARRRRALSKLGVDKPENASERRPSFEPVAAGLFKRGNRARAVQWELLSSGQVLN